MLETRQTYWHDQLDSLAREMSRLAIACDIELFEAGVAERIIRNDDSVCGRKNPDAFRDMRQHVMAWFPLEQAAVEELGAKDTKALLDHVWETVKALRAEETTDPTAGLK